MRESVKYSAPDGKLERPADMDVFRFALSRRIHTLLGDARRCREAVCRRMKRCAGPDLRCHRDFAGPPVTPEQFSRMQAELKRALERRLAELGE
jgi:hypothetical protein